MCDGISLKADVQELAEYFGVDQVLNGYTGRELFKPTEDIPVLLGKNGNRCLDQFAWGIFPFWAKDSIRARSESIRDHHAYKQIYAKQRCVVPCDGFYFRVPDGRKKEKLVRVGMNDRTFCGLAALYDIWVSPGGAEYKMCTVMTKPESADFPFGRLPVILNEESMELWLSSRLKDDERLAGMMLHSIPEDRLQVWA
jgi:putative SOS response-associated peptidase YedK